MSDNSKIVNKGLKKLSTGANRERMRLQEPRSSPSLVWTNGYVSSCPKQVKKIARLSRQNVRLSFWDPLVYFERVNKVLSSNTSCIQLVFWFIKSIILLSSTPDICIT